MVGLVGLINVRGWQSSPAVGKQAGPGHSVRQIRLRLSTEADRFEPLQDFPGLWCHV